jgi:hypothetical protein
MLAHRNHRLHQSPSVAVMTVEGGAGFDGAVVAATAILDRFLHHAQVIPITGRSYRLKDRAGKQAGKENQPAKKENPCGEDA